jgi:AcrR family transcriptional regulator
MKAVQIQQLKDVIATELARQQASSVYQQWLDERATNLHELVALPAGRERATLVEFLDAYIEFLPACFEYFTRVSEAANIGDYADVFLGIAMGYLMTQPENGPRDMLVHEAFMAHRIFEELNDRCGRLLGEPVIAQDNAMANIVVHGLIGDAFANELDVAVHFALETHRDKEVEMIDKLTSRPEHHWLAATENWPVFGEGKYFTMRYRF